MGEFSATLAYINSFIWHDYVLYAIVGTGVLFTVWSGFSQYRALMHGPAIIRGIYDDPNDPGAINHFQALSAALSATVGLGNIGGVALDKFGDVAVAAAYDQVTAVADDAAGAFVQEMIDEERTHVQLLAVMKTYLQDPGSWFEGRERSLLDGA